MGLLTDERSGGARSDQMLRQLFEANRRVLAEAPDMTLSVFSTFLGVALWGGSSRTEDPLTFRELGEHIGLPYTTVSRHLRYLGEWQRPGVPGLGLIKTDTWVLNQRQKTAALTPRGKALADQLLYFLDKGAA